MPENDKENRCVQKISKIMSDIYVAENSSAALRSNTEKSWREWERKQQDPICTNSIKGERKAWSMGFHNITI